MVLTMVMRNHPVIIMGLLEKLHKNEQFYYIPHILTVIPNTIFPNCIFCV